MTATITNACKGGMLDSADADGLDGGTPHLSLHSAFPPSGGNELTGGSPAYARQAVTIAASGGTDTRAMTGTETFDVAAGSTVRAVALYDASTAGTQKCWGPAGASARRAFAVDAADLTNNDIQSPAHGLASTNRVLFWPTVGAALPTGLSEDTEYFVIATGLTTDAFRVSTTEGGSAVDITAIGDGEVQKYVAETYAGQGTYQVSAFSVKLPG